MLDIWWSGILGGAMIGSAAALLWLTHGRVAGISGLLASMLSPAAERGAWRPAFIAGLLLAGLAAAVLDPGAVGPAAGQPAVVAAGGLLVGIGTRIGSGCTSGHGVCGLSRFSARSLVAVSTFLITGAVTAWVAGGVA